MGGPVVYNERMYEVHLAPLDLTRTADSGQCFRMRMIASDTCFIQAQDRYVTVTDLGGGHFGFSCDEAEYHARWASFLDAGTDYGPIHDLAHDEYARQAVDFARGVRILRQDPWETLIGFILSQRKNIPAIRHCVEQLCVRFGRPIGDGLYAFPTPEALANAPQEELAVCSLGYRTRYVSQTARMVASGQADLYAWRTQDDAALESALLTLPGVGVKVAACVMLFGYHRLNAFPVDVWIDRVMKNEYGGRFPVAHYAPYAGVIQQYLFVYARHMSRTPKPEG